MNRLSAALIVSSLALTGCFSDSGNPDGGDSRNVQVSGVAVDGYIAGARVYADLNDNNRRDQYEPRALTDAFGFFSYRPEVYAADGTLIAEARDYCRQGPQHHCLRLPSSLTTATLRVQGGYDLFLGVPFEGSLSRRISIGNSDSNHILAVTPLTTVSGRISPETLDVWDDHGVAGGFQAPLAELSVEIHAIVSYLVRALFDELDLTPDALPPELAADLHAAVYLGLREVLRSSEDALAGWRSLEQGALEPEFLALIETIAPSYGSAGVLAETLAAELLFLRDMMVDEAEVSSSGSGISGNGGLGTRAVAEARMLFVSAAAITEGRRSVGKEQLRRLRELRAAFEELLGREPKLRQGLDLVALGNIIQTHGSGDPVDLRPAVINEGLPRVAGQRLVVNVDSDSADGVITLYFGEGAPDADGPLTVCILGEFESVDFSDLADSTSEGLRLTGEWSQPRDNVLLLTLRALGDSFEETASLRLRSGTDGDTWRFTFGYDGKSEEMAVDRSQHDFESIDSHDIPASSAACAQRF